MTAYLVRRLLQGILVLLLVTIFIFLVMRLLLGDPLMLYISQAQLPSYSGADMAKLRHEYGLDRSLPMQYFNWVGGLF